MSINCREIMRIPIMKEIRLLAGHEGLGRKISWVYLLEDPRYIEWLKGGELIIITGSNTPSAGKELCMLMENLDAKKVSGVIINLSFYISSVPDEVIRLADELSLPLFEMPAEMRIVEVSQEIGYAIFQNAEKNSSVKAALLQIYYGSRITSKRTFPLEKAGFRTGTPYRGMVLQNAGAYEDAAEEIVKSCFEVETPLLADEGNSLFLLLPDEILSMDRTRIGNLAENLGKVMKETLRIGIGSVFHDLHEMRKSIDEGNLALTFTSESDGQIVWYDNLIEIRLINTISDDHTMTGLSEKILGPLFHEDNRILLDTLEAYIHCDFSADKASEELFIHKNTMYNRIRKIEELLNMDLKDHRSLFQIMFILEYMKYHSGIQSKTEQ